MNRLREQHAGRINPIRLEFLEMGERHQQCVLKIPGQRNGLEEEAIVEMFNIIPVMKCLRVELWGIKMHPLLRADHSGSEWG